MISSLRIRLRHDFIFYPPTTVEATQLSLFPHSTIISCDTLPTTTTTITTTPRTRPTTAKVHTSIVVAVIRLVLETIAAQFRLDGKHVVSAEYTFELVGEIDDSVSARFTSI